MIKLFLYEGMTFIIPLYVFKNSVLEGDKLRTYLHNSPIKIPVSQKLQEALQTEGYKDWDEVQLTHVNFCAVTDAEAEVIE